MSEGAAVIFIGLEVLQHSHHCQQHGDDQSGGDGREDDALPAGRILPPGLDVFHLQGSGGRLFPGRFSQPMFRFLQIFTAHGVAVAPAVGVPFHRPANEAGVHLHPVQVGVDGLNQLGQSGGIIVLRPHVDPVGGGDFFVHGVPFLGIAEQDGDEAFVVGNGRCQFIAAHFGIERIGADDKKDGVGPFNSPLNFCPPVGAEGNAFPIYPGFNLAANQSFMQLADKFFIFTRIRNKDTAVAWPRPIPTGHILYPCFTSDWSLIVGVMLTGG